MSQPLVSIVTVCFNSEATIGDLVRDVVDLQSRFKNIEWIVIDGLSSDRTIDIVKGSRAEVCLVSESDSGIYNAMNKGACLAKGQYLLFINSDDRILVPGFIFSLQYLASAKEKIITFDSLYLVREAKLPFAKILRFNSMLFGVFNTMPHQSTFIERELLISEPYDESLKIVADFVFFAKCLASHVAIGQYKFPIAMMNDGGASGDITRTDSEFLRASKIYAGNFKYGGALIYVVLRRLKRVFARLL